MAFRFENENDVFFARIALHTINVCDIRLNDER